MPWSVKKGPARANSRPLAASPEARAGGPAGSTGFLFQAGPDGVEDPLLVGKLAGLELGVDQFPVHGDLEGAAAGGDQLQVLDALLVLGQELGRQTDGL